MAIKSAISFGLVYIPVKLHTAVAENRISFNLIDKNTMSRIKYIKTCVDCKGKEVKNSDIVKGYEYESNKYVLFEEEDYQKIETKKDKSIVIESFIDFESVDAVYFQKSYFVQPAGAEKAYALLLRAMREQNRAGLAKTVMAKKENLVLLRPYGDALMLSTLYFGEEVKALPFSTSLPDSSKAELAMACSLIDSMNADFTPQEYVDDYNLRLKKAIDAKIAGKEVKTVRESDSPRVFDLMKALELSLERQSPAKKTAQKKPAVKKTPAKVKKQA